VNADHTFTGRLTGFVGVDGAHIDLENERAVRTYTLLPGLSYAITPTLRASLSAGPSLVERGDDFELRPAASASLVHEFKFGTVSFGYVRAVSAGADSIADSNNIFASLLVPTLVRGLRLGVTPRYNFVERDVTGDDRSDYTVLSVNVRAVYQIARSISLFASYTYYRETDDLRDGNINQNRVFLGVQYAFPINFY
jgi:hypothetical protein